MLLIAGLGASLDLTAPFERELAARGRRVISFDAPGVGGSTSYRRPPRMAGVARTALQMLDELGVDQVDVLGLSLGGAVAQEMARLAPGRVRRLVLAAAVPGLGGVPGSPRVLLSLASSGCYRDPAFYRQVVGQVYGGVARTDSANLLHALGAMRPPSVWGYVGQLWALTGWTSAPWLHTLRQPTLVLTGDDDPLVPVINGRILAWRIPHATLRIVRGGGHLFLIERPAELAETVVAFLRQGDADRPQVEGGVLSST